MSRPAVVIDTNVLIAANHRDTHVSADCSLNAARRLNAARQAEVVLLDTLGHIFLEYKCYCNFTGQPGAGDMFFLYLHQKRWDEAAGKILQIPINENPSVDQGNRNYIEFPDDPDFAGFDPSDQKFVAVGIASGKNPAILNASDNDDWENYRVALEKHGLFLEQLCPEK